MKSSFRIVSSIFAKNYLRGIEKKTTILNTILFALPIFVLSYFMREHNLGFMIITSIYLGIFILMHFKSVLTSLFIFDEYETYLGFPTSIKEIWLSKFIVLNLGVGIQSLFIVLAYFFDGFIQGQAWWYYEVVLVGYILGNFLVLLLSFLLIFIYYKVKNLILGKNISFAELIESISKKEKTYKRRRYKRESKLKTLVMMDIQKVLRNKKLFLGWIVNTVMMFGGSIFFFGIMPSSFNSTSMYSLILILVQVSILGGMLPLIAFSKSEVDQEFILLFPVEVADYKKSKVVAGCMMQIPVCLFFMAMTFIFLNAGFIYKILTCISIVLVTITCVCIATNNDGRNINFSWSSLDELGYKRMPFMMGYLFLAPIVIGPFYVGPLFLKWITFELAITVISLSSLVLIRQYYKKILEIEL
ncbi:MAG: hypothetical protein ACRCWG_18320 [Sarcina sp.]